MSDKFLRVLKILYHVIRVTPRKSNSLTAHSFCVVGTTGSRAVSGALAPPFELGGVSAAMYRVSPSRQRRTPSLLSGQIRYLTASTAVFSLDGSALPRRSAKVGQRARPDAQAFSRTGGLQIARGGSEGALFNGNVQSRMYSVRKLFESSFQICV